MLINLDLKNQHNKIKQTQKNLPKKKMETKQTPMFWGRKP